MWLSRVHYDAMRADLVAAMAVLDSQTANISALNTTVDWFRVRITQLEHERALLLKTYMGIAIPSLSIERVIPESSKPSYDPVPHFDDVGDEAAQRMGIDWDPETSEVTYRSLA